jgi:hypothetical protein
MHDIKKVITSTSPKLGVKSAWKSSRKWWGYNLLLRREKTGHSILCWTKFVKQEIYIFCTNSDLIVFPCDVLSRRSTPLVWRWPRWHASITTIPLASNSGFSKRIGARFVNVSLLSSAHSVLDTNKSISSL